MALMPPGSTIPGWDLPNSALLGNHSTWSLLTSTGYFPVADTNISYGLLPAHTTLQDGDLIQFSFPSSP